MTKTSGWLEERLKEIQGLEQYSIEDSLAELITGMGPNSFTKLDANENFFIPISTLKSIFKEVSRDLDPRVYPISEEKILVNELKDHFGFDSDQIVIGNGADQIIELIAKAFLKDSESAVAIKPTFSMYSVTVNSLRKKYIEVPLNDDFSLNIDALLSRVTKKTVVCFICTPNNPTANQFKISEIERFTEEFEGIVALDEAYVEFAPYSMIKLVDRFENLIVLRTFSKVFGLAGMRVGYSVANSRLSSVLMRIKPPYNINSFSLRAALGILREKSTVNRALLRLKVERNLLIERLNRIQGIKAFSSDTNFVLFNIHGDSNYVFKELLGRRILVKNVGRILSQNGYLRTSVGLPEMNAKLLNALEDICGSETKR
ncbi:MAG: histidinol-phosphate aminotransferase [Thermoproteota archaeon]|nr:histidinol-phosphate aminotransferase [Thermoproteota archaeon]